jgi:hypothetical protein
MTTAQATAVLPVTTRLTEQVGALGRHLRHCHAAQGRLFTLSLWTEQAHQLVAPRFVTTVVVAALVIALACAWA